MFSFEFFTLELLDATTWKSPRLQYECTCLVHTTPAPLPPITVILLSLRTFLHIYPSPKKTLPHRLLSLPLSPSRFLLSEELSDNNPSPRTSLEANEMGMVVPRAGIICQESEGRGRESHLRPRSQLGGISQNWCFDFGRGTFFGTWERKEGAGWMSYVHTPWTMRFSMDGIYPGWDSLDLLRRNLLIGHWISVMVLMVSERKGWSLKSPSAGCLTRVNLYCIEPASETSYVSKGWSRSHDPLCFRLCFTPISAVGIRVRSFVGVMQDGHYQILRLPRSKYRILKAKYIPTAKQFPPTKNGNHYTGTIGIPSFVIGMLIVRREHSFLGSSFGPSSSINLIYSSIESCFP